MLHLIKTCQKFSQNLKPPAPRCLVIHPVSYPNKGPTTEHYLAEEAIGLVSSLGWQVVAGPFWNNQKIDVKQLFADLPRNTVYMEPQYGDEIKDGTYVKSSLGNGVYYKDGIIFDEEDTQSDGDLHKEWQNKIIRENLATSSLLKCKKITQKYFFTKGKIQKIVAHVISSKTDCIFINNELKPGQIRNLKKVIEARLNEKNPPRGYSYGMDEQNSETQLDSTEEVQDPAKKPLREKQIVKKIQIFDRFSIILQIFAQRTTSKLAKLQIELSYLAYLKTRLVRDGSTYSSNLNFFSGNLLQSRQINLEIISAKQRRAMGIMSGQGQSQLEIERRNIRDKEAKIRKQIQTEQKLRLNRKQKDKKRNLEVPVIALVGYTNVGKSAFMNFVIGKEEVQSKDLLFQTLKTTARYITLPSGTRAALLDTIGFITDLPIQMVDAFKATLEDIVHADLVIHLRDISHPQNELQKQSVLKILKELNVDEKFWTDKMVEVWNKADLIVDRQIELLEQKNAPPILDGSESQETLQISCKTGKNMKKFLSQVDQKLKKIRGLELQSIQYDYARHYKVIQWLKVNANVSYNLNEEHNYDKGTVKITIQANQSTIFKLKKFLADLQGSNNYPKSKNKNKGMPPKEGW